MNFSSAVSGRDNDIHIHALSDSSGYFAIASNKGSNNDFIWKFLLSTSSSADWQEITSVIKFCLNSYRLIFL